MRTSSLALVASHSRESDFPGDTLQDFLFDRVLVFDYASSCVAIITEFCICLLCINSSELACGSPMEHLCPR